MLEAKKTAPAPAVPAECAEEDDRRHHQVAEGSGRSGTSGPAPARAPGRARSDHGTQADRPGRHDLAQHGPAGQPDGHRERDDPRRARWTGTGSAPCCSERVVDRYPVFRQRPVCLVDPARSCRTGRTTPTSTSSGTCTGPCSTRPATTPRCRTTSTGSSAPRCPRDRPLWEMHLIDGYGDGVGRLLPAAPRARRRDRADPGAALDDRRRRRTTTSSEPLEDDRTAAAVLDTAVHLAERHRRPRCSTSPTCSPQARAEDAFTLARQTTGDRRRSCCSPATPSRRSRARRTSGSGRSGRQPFPLDDVLEAGHRTGTTVNDVLVAALAGARRVQPAPTTASSSTSRR